MRDSAKTPPPRNEPPSTGDTKVGRVAAGMEAAVFAAFLAGCLFLVVWGHVAGFSPVMSDAKDNLRWSRVWWDFDQRESTHLPAYSILLWTVRTMSLGWLDNGPLLLCVAGTCSLGSLVLGVLIFRRYFPDSRTLGVLLFGLYPFIALAAVYDPRADALATLCVAGSVFSLLGRKWWLFGLCLAIGLATHKAIWLFLALLAADAVFRRKCPAFIVVLAAVPLASYWAWGLAHGQGFLWLLRSNYGAEFASHSSLPIMDGLLGTFIHQTHLNRLLKGLFVLGYFVLVVGLLIWNLRGLRSSCFLLHFALLFPVFVLMVILNQYEIWASIRFSRVTAISLACAIAGSPRMRRFLENRAVLAMLFLALLASNLAFGLYVIYAPRDTFIY